MSNKNDDKARAVLNRWWYLKRQAYSDPDPDRPQGISKINMVDSIIQCQKWRHQVMVDINRDITFIQNRALGQAKIRELNDQINKFIRQKYHWERRIRQLGGPDYQAMKDIKGLDKYGAQIQAYGGYRYFGAAKDIPGVRQFHQREVPVAPQRSSKDIKNSITQLSKYYGDEDQQSQILKQAEQQETQLWRNQELKHFMQKNKQKIKEIVTERSVEGVLSRIDQIEFQNCKD